MKNFRKKMMTVLASEAVLGKDWDMKEEDEAWKNL